MLRIVGRKITLTRGDSAELSIKVSKRDGGLYKLNPNDRLTFTIKKTITDESPLLQKEFTGNNVVVLTPEDTKPLSFGKHIYDIQLSLADGSIYTVVPSSEFIIAEEVTI